LVVTETFIRTE